MPADRVAALRKTALFGSLDASTLSALAQRTAEIRLARNEILFLAGDSAKGLYVIVEGAVRAFRVGTDGREQVIHVERQGATLAELPVFDEGPYPSTAAAEEDSILLFIEKQHVKQLCTEHPDIGLAALRLLARRLRRCAELVETLSLRDVDRRLAKLLLDEARSHGTKSDKGLEVELSMTNQQLAARIGTVREVVSRAFGRLQQAGLVHADGRLIRIPDPDALNAYLSQ